MKVKDRIQQILNAHKMMCPYWVIDMGKVTPNLTYMCDHTIQCGANHKECNGECWYMKTFRNVIENQVYADKLTH